MILLKGRNLIRDGACLIILIVLAQHNIKKQFIKHASTKRIAKYVARQSFIHCADSVSKSYKKLSEIAQKTKKRLEKKLSKN